MGRELQKKKRRSGRQPVRRRPSEKAQKKILNNPLIRENWNKKETLAQNYRRLGLVSKLNKRAGGIQRLGTDAEKVNGEPNPFAIKPGTTRATVTQKLDEVVLERDEETGELVVKDDGSAKLNPLNDPLFGIDDQDEKDWVTVMGHIGKEKDGVVKTGMTEALEDLARSGTKKKPRHQSEREEDWLQALVDKHGQDYEAMFRDRQLNIMQQSQGDLKKRVKKWLTKRKSDGD
jgi:nucleolar protein 16